MSFIMAAYSVAANLSNSVKDDLQRKNVEICSSPARKQLESDSSYVEKKNEDIIKMNMKQNSKNFKLNQTIFVPNVWRRVKEIQAT